MGANTDTTNFNGMKTDTAELFDIIMNEIKYRFYVVLIHAGFYSTFKGAVILMSQLNLLGVPGLYKLRVILPVVWLYGS